MAEPVEALVLDLLEWIGPQPKPYADVLEAWRTSCPRLPVWEEANARGLVTREHRPGVGTFVCDAHLSRSHAPRGNSRIAALRLLRRRANCHSRVPILQRKTSSPSFRRNP